MLYGSAASKGDQDAFQCIAFDVVAYFAAVTVFNPYHHNFLCGPVFISWGRRRILNGDYFHVRSDAAFSLLALA